MNNLLKEYIGKQIDIYNSTEKIRDIIIDSILKFDYIRNGYNWSFILPIESSDDFKESTKIQIIKFNISYKENNKENISGYFNTDKLILLDNGFYEININLIISIKENIIKYKDNIENVISHELNHAFVFIKKINKKSKLNLMNKTKNIINIDMFLFLKENEFFKYFMNMIYLSLPEEVSARVQETSTILKNINKTNYKQTIEQLKKYQPLIDAKKMISYNLYDIDNISDEKKEFFIKKFNENKKIAYKDIKFKKIENIDKFFIYWKKIINEKGDMLFKKILKLVAYKYNNNYKDIISEMDINYLKELLRIDD